MTSAHQCVASSALCVALACLVGCSGLDGELAGGGGVDTAAGGAGGASGAAGRGGVGGVGGDPIGEDPCSDTATCASTCGTDNAFPGGPGALETSVDCSVMGIPFPLRMTFEVADVLGPEALEGIHVFAQLRFPAATIDLFTTPAACSVDMEEVQVDFTTPGDEAAASVTLSRVPCVICIYEGVPVHINLDPASIDRGGVETAALSITAITLDVDASGFELVLTTEGDAPTCRVLD